MGTALRENFALSRPENTAAIARSSAGSGRASKLKETSRGNAGRSEKEETICNSMKTKESASRQL
jgi:hypothetical protein